MDINKLKELRNHRTLSQREFAKILGVAQATVASWEVGRTEPDNTMLKQIANYFNVSIDYLLDNDEQSKQAQPRPILSEKQTRLINGYENLNDNGQNMLMAYLEFLNQSYSRYGAMAK